MWSKAMRPRLHKATGWRLFARTVVARAYPRVIGAQRQLWSIVIDVLLPFLALAAYIFVCRAIGAPEVLIGFVIVGGAMTSFWLNVLWTMTNQFFWERETGNLALYVMAPTSLMAILLGMAVGGMFLAALRAAVILVLGLFVFHVHLSAASLPQVAGVFVLTLIALYGMGMTCSSLFVFFGRDAWHVSGLLNEPGILLSGMYFPVSSLNRHVAMGATAIPMTLGLDAIRQLVFSGQPSFGLLSVRTEAAMLAAQGALFLTTARLMLAFMESRARIEGRLTESRG
jgi:ABC-2 type transport system permease protein